MRAALATACLFLVTLAGCGEPPAAVEPEEFSDLTAEVDEDHGLVRGVVVDETITPVAGATVRLAAPEGGRETETDGEGRFLIPRVPAGTHLLNVTKLNHEAVQVSVPVVAGDPLPDLVRVQLARLYDQAPYLQQEHFQGHIACGYALPFMSSLCLNDYTRFIPGNNGSAPQLQQTGLDDRDHDFAVGAGWQTLQFEMTWEPSAQGTSSEMRIILSHFPRPATHWYAATGGPDPVTLRVEQGVVHEDQQDEPALIPPEGLENAHFFTATQPEDGQFASVAIEQDFEVFLSFFYHGKPPEGWSFLAGDGNPF